MQDLFAQGNFRFHPEPKLGDANCKLRTSHVEQLYNFHADRLCTYDMVQQAISEAVESNTHSMIKCYDINSSSLHPEHCVRPPVISRKKTISELKKMYGIPDMTPVKRRIKLPHTGKYFTLVSYPFAYSLLSLLTDSCLMQSDNLLLPLDGPIGNPPAGCSSRRFNDIDTGTVFKGAHRRLCKDPLKDLLCALLLGADATALDSLQKTNLEPLLFTLSFFKRHVRQMPQAWRIIGYLPQMDEIAPKADADDKLKDYHFCLRVLLWDLTRFQSVPGGLDWCMKYRGVDHQVKLHIPVLFVIGDNKGHDKWVGLKTGKGQGAKCRYCLCPYEETDNPNFETMNWDSTRLAPKMEKLIANSLCGSVMALTDLTEQNFKPMRLGSCDVVFADQKQGIYGATLAESLHSNQKGFCEYAVKCFFDVKKVVPKKRKKLASNNQPVPPPLDHDAPDTDDERSNSAPCALSRDDEEEEGGGKRRQ